MHILGLSHFYYDSAAAIIRDGDIIAAAQEERFTRKKHDFSFPKNAVHFCLEEAKISIKDVDYISFYEKPFIKFERILETYLAYAPRGINSFIKAIPMWMKKKLWIRELIKKELGYDQAIIFPEHHEAHAASAFFPSPYKEAAILTMDGVGEWTTASFGVGCGNTISFNAEIKFPHSLGLLYSAFTYYTGFKVNSGEYKVMGLAPYGRPVYTEVIKDELIDLKEDGSFRLNMKYFNYCAGLTMTNEKFHNLFGGPPRKPESILTQRDMDLACSIQDVTEEAMLRMARHAHKVTGKEYLTLGGGVALNCVGNGRILRETPFKGVWVQPAAGDAGGALGAALFTWYQYLGNARNADDVHDYQKGSFLGPEYASDEIIKFLEAKNAPYVLLKDDEIPERIADLIASEKVIGWFEGRMEFGPRALGARSIIADARSAKMQELMNIKIKFRESFRPFAPSVLEEKASEYFDITSTSPYMLFVAPVAQSKRRRVDVSEEGLFGLARLYVSRSAIPAVTHVDHSARVQTICRRTNPVFYDMIKKFYEKYGCPVIINTSFNVRGEPIVESPEHAYTCFMRTNMDYLIMGNCLLEKQSQKPLDKDIDWLKTYELD
ncbi:MAG: carbamoyltransferase [Candidatus Omnitrophota bacterium]|nr:carbamoyltransferase [Candidatus Omnitrophota bacterium]